jgi:hypothetical protein
VGKAAHYEMDEQSSNIARAIAGSERNRAQNASSDIVLWAKKTAVLAVRLSSEAIE